MRTYQTILQAYVALPVYPSAGCEVHAVLHAETCATGSHSTYFVQQSWIAAMARRFTVCVTLISECATSKHISYMALDDTPKVKVLNLQALLSISECKRSRHSLMMLQALHTTFATPLAHALA